MSGLLFLADVAESSERSLETQTKKVDACIQTCDFGPRLCSYVCGFPQSGNQLFPLPPSAVHDYLKQTEVDYAVNSTHDYYCRICPPETDLEHSYAFPVVSHRVSDKQKDTACETSADPDIAEYSKVNEEIANLDQYMGLDTNCYDNSDAEIKEEYVDDLLSDRDVMSTIAKDSFGSAADDDDSLSFERTLVETIELGDADFNDLLKYLAADEDFEGFELCASKKQNTQIFDGKSKTCQGNKTASKRRKSAPKRLDALMSEQKVGRTKQFGLVESHASLCFWGHCRSKFADVSELSKHILQAHVQKPSSGGWLCCWKSCSRKDVFSKRYLLVRHVRIHTGEKPFECSHCEKSFSTYARMIIHVRRHEKNFPYTCNACGKSFASTADRVRHGRTHQKRDKSFLCPVAGCERKYMNRQSVNKHVRLKHG